MTFLIDQLTYDRWANLRLIDAVSGLDSQVFRETVTSSFPSIRQTLVHILWAEELWLERWQGCSFVQSLDPNEFSTVEMIRRRFEDIHARQITFLKSLHPAAAERIAGYLNFQGQRWEYSLRQMVQHLMVHSAYHRGQLVTLLRQSGVVPPGTDYLQFIDSL
jgi:uncharacterized damage-inducible protein DinB